MKPSAGRYKGKLTAEPSMIKKAFGELPLLQELLPKASLQHAYGLSNDDKEVLVYLIEYGCRAIHAEAASLSACKLPWKPWKVASMASKKEQVSSSCAFLDSRSGYAIVGEAVSSRRTLWIPANRIACSTCDCFSCYSRFWSRWNSSPNRDLINEILDVIEESPNSSKVKKKKRVDKKRGAEASKEKSGEGDGNLHKETVRISNVERVTDIQIIDETYRVPDKALGITMQMPCVGRKNSIFRVAKQKGEVAAANVKSNKASGAEGSEEEKDSVDLGPVGDSADGMDAGVRMEVSAGSFTAEASEVTASGFSPALLSAKSTSKRRRIAKRRHSQVIPLDCEGFSDIEREQEAAITVENTQFRMSPRAADTGLGGRGFLARVFPDTLGRVATRLWDLVSVRLRSRTVEYH